MDNVVVLNNGMKVATPQGVAWIEIQIALKIVNLLGRNPARGCVD